MMFFHLSAYLSSIDITTGTFHAVECMLTFSTFLYRNGYPRSDVVLYVTRAMDFLLQHDDEHGADMADMAEVAGGGEATSVAGSKLSKTSKASKMSSTRKSKGSRSESRSESRSTLMSATAAATSEGGKESAPPTLNLTHFDQLLQG